MAVYALNNEFKALSVEVKNGMVRGVPYLVAKSILVIPILFVLALFALGIPAFVIQDIPVESFGLFLSAWITFTYFFECSAELFAILCEDPRIGMLLSTNLD